MSGVARRKTRSILSLLDGPPEVLQEEQPKQKDSRLETLSSGGRIRRSSRSRITDYFPPSTIPSDVIDDIILDEEEFNNSMIHQEEEERTPSEGGSCSSGKENDSISGDTMIQNAAAFVPAISTRSKAHFINKMPLTTFADNVSPPPSPSKLGTSPSNSVSAAALVASSPPTPHRIKLMSIPQPYHVNHLKISLTPKKSIIEVPAQQHLLDANPAASTTHEETNNINNNNNIINANSDLGKNNLNFQNTLLANNNNTLNKKQSSKKTKKTVISTKKRTITPTSPAVRKPNNTAKNTPASLSNGSHRVTEYFPIRRSSRKSKKELDKQYTAELEDTLRNSSDDHLDLGIAYYSLKGRGIQAMRNFSKGEFVVEYAGDLLEVDIAKERESQYSKDHSTGCYMYYFKHSGKQYCVDATKDTGRLGRLVNHSRLHPNLLTKVVMLENKPRLILVARQDIEKYSELLYDYGDRSKESLIAHPWLSL